MGVEAPRESGIGASSLAPQPQIRAEPGPLRTGMKNDMYPTSALAIGDLLYVAQ